ncbi:hypothetical protein N0V88_005315 [Collariella sp. IMI 366227]|nr:hypothetical protein N0V88_005315 [Collariella sp. IMI 366227]
MADKILIFSGAPESRTLNWDSDDLLSEFQDAIVWLTDIDTRKAVVLPPASSRPDHAAWRSISLDRVRLPTGFSQQHEYVPSLQYGPDDATFGPSSEFLTTVSLSFADTDNGELPALSQLYEHSMIIHQELPSSQLVSQSTGHATSFLDDDTTSFLSGDGSQAGSVKGPLLFRGSDLLSDLKNVPSAAYLDKIRPQTMTCNLVPQVVNTRWGSKYLAEILVGDETKAGFAITYWLPYDTVEESPLAGLRPRDIVLMQNVALNVFTKKVYGSSLRKNLTKLHLLYRMKLDSRDAGGYYSTSDLSSHGDAHPQLEKTRRVRDWVINFVGLGNHDTRRTDPGPRWNRPPADETQLV